MPELNPDYELVYIDQEEDKVFLKNHFFKNMVSLSKAEYEIIQYYVDHPNHEEVFAHYSQQYDISRDFVYALVSRAELSGVLTNEKYLARKEKVKEESKSRVDNFFVYFIISKVQTLVSLFGLKAKLESIGNFKYYRLLSFDLERTVLKRWVSKRFVQTTIIALYFITLAMVAYALISIDSYSIDKSAFKLSISQAFLVIPILLVGFIIFTFLHEIGHFLLYKKYGGLTSEMGFAFMMGIIPTLYVTTSSLHLWKSRGKRLLVMAGGTLVDILLLLLCLYFTYSSGSGTISFYGYIFSVMMVYRIVFNINPFIPRTDGYFVLCDLISNSTFHNASYVTFTSVIVKVKSLQWRTISLSEVVHAFYFVMSIFFIVTNYILLFSPIIIFLYYWIIGVRK
jgi:hypothetical protein